MMNAAPSSEEIDKEIAGGFGVLDEKGRISLPKSVRAALGVGAGSSMAYIVLDRAVMLIPQDEHLASLMARASEALSAAGLTVQDVLADIEPIHAEVMEETYGADFVHALERLHAAYRAEASAEHSADPAE